MVIGRGVAVATGRRGERRDPEFVVRRGQIGAPGGRGVGRAIVQLGELSAVVVHVGHESRTVIVVGDGHEPPPRAAAAALADEPIAGHLGLDRGRL